MNPSIRHAIVLSLAMLPIAYGLDAAFGSEPEALVAAVAVVAVILGIIIARLESGSRPNPHS